MNDTINQLIILGNGFDLECGLPSSFADYYATRQDHLKEWLDAASNGNDSHHISIWDFIFEKEHKSNPSWTDVESIIADWISKLYAPINISQEYRDWLNQFISDNAKTVQDAEHEYNDWSVRLNPRKESTLPSLQAQCTLAQIEHDKLSLADFLFLQLKSLEDGFEQYIQQSAQATIYHDNSEKLFRLISQYDANSTMPYTNDKKILNNVLSFNYTKMNPSPTLTKSELGVWRNVHGTIGSHNIIFGIDPTQFSGPISCVSVTQFTKTFRALQLDSQIQNTDIFQSLKKGIPFQSVKFYGHGLGKADYSYFKSIFDLINLYSSQVQLIFLYPSDRPQERNYLFLRVSDLLNRYGNTMVDQKRGQNLLHKLILENRLHISLLDTGTLENGECNKNKSLSYREAIISNAFKGLLSN